MILSNLIALGVLFALGTALDKALHLTPATQPVRFPLRIVIALAFTYVAWALPWLLAPLLGIAWWTRPKPPIHERSSIATPDKPLLALAFALAAWIASRPATPFLWDEFVWLAKARMEASSPGTLVPEALRPDSIMIPEGYPVFAPLACALLAGLSPATDTLVRAANELTFLALVVFGLAFHASYPKANRWFTGAVLLACPLVLVHLRAAYVDVVVGLLSAALVSLIEEGMLRSACAVALALVGAKDEGTIHVLAISFAVASCSVRFRDLRERGAALVPAAFALIFAGAWKVRLAFAGVVDDDHALGAPQLERLRDIGATLVRDATDVWSWGLFWPAVLAIVLSHALRARRAERERVFAAALGLQLLGLVFGIVMGPDRLMEFLMNGSLMNRLLVQLAPIAMLLVLATCSRKPVPQSV